MKLSIVTPSLNSELTIGETIKSVLSQRGDFEIEYVVVDGGSTDKTIDIINECFDKFCGKSIDLKCEKIDVEIISGEDSGMYEAIKKGFLSSSGEIMAWINSDDIYLPGAFEVMVNLFKKFESIEWAKGITSYINGLSKNIIPGSFNIYNKEWIMKGYYGPSLYFIQQDSVFWRRDLWDRAGGIDTKFKLAGDYSLWREFAKFSELWSINYNTSCFRRIKGQKSEKIQHYWDEIRDFEKIRSESFWVRRFFKYEEFFPKFLKHSVFRLVSGENNEYCVVLLSEDGSMARHVGDYYAVKQSIDGE